MPKEIPPEKMDEINEAIFVRRKIEAIKLYREQTGEGLKEAKDFIEALTKRLHEESPDKFRVEPSNSGCTGVLLCVAIVVSAATWWLCA